MAKASGRQEASCNRHLERASGRTILGRRCSRRCHRYLEHMWQIHAGIREHEASWEEAHIWRHLKVSGNIWEALGGIDFH